MSDYSILELNVGDAVALHVFYQDSELKKFYRPYGEDVSLHAIVSMPIARVAAGSEIGLIVCDSDNNIFGHAFLRQNPNNKSEYGFGIGVSEKLRGRGLGKRLMLDLFELGRRKGVERITLSVFSDNKKAHEMYLRNGFKELKRVVGKTGEESIFMVKSYSDDVAVAEELLNDQRIRRARLFSAYHDVARDWFNERGEWALPGRALVADGVGGLREIYWHSLGMLFSDDPAIVAKTMVLLEKKQTKFCAFAPFVALQILHNHSDKLSDAAKSQLLNYVSINLKKSCTCDFQFHGYNDNMPAMKAFTLIAGGEMLGESKYVEQGLANLCQLRALFRRRGFLNEFNSPTYTSITLMALSEIANFAKNRDAVELAETAGERVFADIAFHWHRPTSGLAGPYSRAYTLDSVGHCTIMNMFMWLMMGEEFVPINPMRYYFGDESDQVVLHHKGFLPFLQVSSVWHCSSIYLVYPDLIDYLRNSRCPRTVSGTAESGPATPGKTEVDKIDGSYKLVRYGDFSHPFLNYSAASHLEQRWTLGTSTGYMCDGRQSEVFFVRYASKPLAENETVAGVEEVRTLYARYLVNECSNYIDYEENGETYNLPDDLLPNNGVEFAFQHCENNSGTAMFCCKPAPFSTTEPVRTLRLRLLIHAAHGKPEIRKTDAGDVLIVENGLNILIKPMTNSDLSSILEGEAKVEIGADGDWMYIDIFNYDGEPREFGELELQRFCNGFVCEIAESPFDDAVLSARPKDHYYLEQRRVSYERDGVTLETDYDPVSMGIRHITVNEKAYTHDMLEVSDYGVGKLPWMASATPEPPKNFDWRALIHNRKNPYQ